MARPKKATVDYFPHECKHGMVHFVMESIGGNDAYALIYKVREVLGDSDGHVFDLRKPGNRDYLLAYVRLDGDTLDLMLAKLAELGVIDEELLKDGLIWSEPFVQDLEEVYRRRKVARPQRPVGRSSCEQKPTTTGLPSSETLANGITGDRNRQSKVNETKVDLTIPSPPLEPGVARESSQTDRCPHRAIIDLYHQQLPSLPRIQEWTEKRKTLLRARWREKPERQRLEWWASFFDRVSQSDFLMGRSGEGTFTADLEWLLTAKNVIRVLEGRYDKKASPRTEEKWEQALEGKL